MTQQAYVLKRLYPRHHKVALFDAYLGRIEVVYLKGLLIPGSLIQYYNDRREITRLDDIEVISVPLCWGKNDLLFAHHALELCYYFMPLYSPSFEIFTMLSLLFNSALYPWTIPLKKIFIAKLLMIFSIYPKTPFVTTPFFRTVLYCPPENLLTLDRDGNDMSYIDQWMRQTISEHPMIALFKTTIFLTESR